jgi:cobalt-zinc-cadmium resistance protein CzcA
VVAQVPITENQAIELALKRHPALLAVNQEVAKQAALLNAASTWEPAQLYHQVGADPEFGLFGIVSIGVQQKFPSSKLTRATREVYTNRQAFASTKADLTRLEIIQHIRSLYHHLSYLKSKILLYQKLDSLYQRVSEIANLRYQSGDASKAESLTTRDKAMQMQLEAQTIQHEIEYDNLVLSQTLEIKEGVIAISNHLHEGDFTLEDSTRILNSAISRQARQSIELARAEKAAQEAHFAPTFSSSVLAQYLGNGDMFPGWQVGLNLPLFRKSLKAQNESANIGIAVAEAEYRNVLLQQRSAMAHLLHEQEKFKILIEYFSNEGKLLAAEILRNGEINYKSGEISYVDFIQLVEQATNIELSYLENLYGLNQTLTELETLTGQ